MFLYLDPVSILIIFFNQCVHYFIYFFLFSFTSLSSFFTHIETNQSVGGRKPEYPGKNHLTHPQAELGLSHM